MSFTHDVMMDAILPGVPPTGRAVELPVVVVCGTEGGKVAYERIYWRMRQEVRSLWSRTGSYSNLVAEQEQLLADQAQWICQSI